MKGKADVFFFLCVSFWHKINKNTNHPLRLLEGAALRTWSSSDTRPQKTMCAVARLLHRQPRLRGLCWIWSGCHRRSSNVHLPSTPLSLQQLLCWQIEQQLQPDVLVVPHRRATWRRGSVRNWPNSDADCSVYAALQLGAGGCPRCMCRRRRVCGGAVFGREQAITTSISHPDSLRDGKWLLVGFGRWLWMKKAQSYNGFLTNLIHQLNYWSYRPYQPHPSSINIKRWFITLKHFAHM